MVTLIIISIVFLLIIAILLVILIVKIEKVVAIRSTLERLEARFSDEIRYLREENSRSLKENRNELNEALKMFSASVGLSIKNFQESSEKGMNMLSDIQKDKLSQIETARMK